MLPTLSELKVTPRFCFPLKIPDDPTATNTYVCLHMYVLVCVLRHSAQPHSRLVEEILGLIWCQDSDVLVGDNFCHENQTSDSPKRVKSSLSLCVCYTYFLVKFLFHIHGKFLLSRPLRWKCLKIFLSNPVMDKKDPACLHNCHVRW